MKYIADMLTALRVLFAIGVLLAGLAGLWAVAVVLFVAGILTDAFDGIAARTWPYSSEENARLWWRKDPHKFDNMADVALSTGGLVSLTFTQLPLIGAAVTIVMVALTSAIIQSIVDRIGPIRPKLAERIDVAHGWLYGAELVAMLLLMTALASNNWERFLVVYAITGGILLVLKWDRVTSRKELTYGTK